MTFEMETEDGRDECDGPDPALPLRFVMYLPAGHGPADGRQTSRRVLDAVERILCARFGGVTSYPARGLFKLASGDVQSESVQVLETYCEAMAWRRSASFAFALAETVAGILHQESLACSVGGRLHLLEPHPAGPSRFAPEEDLTAALAAVVEIRTAPHAATNSGH